MAEIVEVATQTTQAVSAPNFIIQDGDCYYVTLAVLGYCYSASNLTSGEEAGIDQVAQTFASTEPKIQAVRLDAIQNLASLQSTSPPRVE